MAKIDWNPKNTKIINLGLGLSDWEDPDDPIGHRDTVLHKFFKKSGVPDKNNLHLRDEKGDYDQLMEILPDFIADSNEDSFLIFYYAGHGGLVEDSELDYDLEFCHPSENSFTFADLIDIIENNFEGWNVLFMIDCCYSGNIARFASESDSDYNYAGLTSSMSSETSTGAWTFTDCVLAALNGKAKIDADKDGDISLKELAAYIKSQMKEVDNQKSDFGFSENFDPEMRLAILK